MIEHILLKRKAIELSPKKPFIFASGIKSPIYCDNRILMSYLQDRNIIIDGFINLIKKNNLKFDIIAGTSTAGIPWAAWIAQELNKPMIFVRKETKDHGKGKKIEGVLRKKARVLLVEDLVSTGGSSLGCVESIRKADAIIDEVISIFTYQLQISKFKFEQKKVKLYSLSNLDLLLKQAIKENFISSEEMKKIQSWRNSPTIWEP